MTGRDGPATGSGTPPGPLKLDASMHSGGVLIVVLMSVTSPFRASSRPVTSVSSSVVIVVSAITVPTIVESTPSVAVSTTQNTLQGLAPLISSTRLSKAVSRRVEAWKIHSAFGSFSASRVRSPVMPRVPSSVE